MSNDPYRAGAPAAASAETTTIITNDAEFKGEVAFSGELQINGRLQGQITSEEGKLIVGEEAVVAANIDVNHVIVYGKVKGDITAQGKLELRGKAQVYGDIRSNRIMVEDGVVFEGKSLSLSQPDGDKPDFANIFSQLDKGSSSPSSSYGSSSDDSPLG